MWKETWPKELFSIWLGVQWMWNFKSFQGWLSEQNEQNEQNEQKCDAGWSESNQ